MPLMRSPLGFDVIQCGVEGDILHHLFVGKQLKRREIPSARGTFGELHQTSAQATALERWYERDAVYEQMVRFFLEDQHPRDDAVLFQNPNFASGNIRNIALSHGFRLAPKAFKVFRIGLPADRGHLVRLVWLGKAYDGIRHVDQVNRGGLGKPVGGDFPADARLPVHSERSVSVR
jgi:hypothetical protein